jgi:hypothetical protein
LGRPATAQEFLSYIRLNFNSFIDTALAFFEPYNPTIDGPKWRSPSPQDAVIHIDMRVGSQWANPDDGSVVTSEFAPDHWVFSTLWTPGDQAHPVSGNREFGFETRQDPNNPTGQVYILYTRGADRPTRVVDNVGSAIIFAMAHALWRSLQARIAGFANGNGGAATVLTPISRRFDWSRVKPFYFAPTVPRLLTNSSDLKPESLRAIDTRGNICR